MIQMWATHEVNSRGHEHHWAHVAILGRMGGDRVAVLDRAGNAFIISENILRSTQREQITTPAVVRRYVRLHELFQIKGTPRSEIEALIKKFAYPAVKLNYKKKPGAVSLPTVRKGAKSDFGRGIYMGRTVK